MGDFSKKQLQYHYRENFKFLLWLFCDQKPECHKEMWLGWPIALSYVSDRLERKRQKGGGVQAIIRLSTAVCMEPNLTLMIYSIFNNKI